MARRNKDSFMSTRRKGGSGFPPLLRRFLVWGFVTLAALVLLGFIGYARLLSYLQGEGFRDSLERLLTDKAQATSAELESTLAIEDNHVSLQGITLTRPGKLQSFSGRNIHAELRRGALLDGELYVTRLMVEEGRLELNIDRSEETPGRVPAGRQESAPDQADGAPKGKEEPAPRRRSRGFLSRLVPTSARLDRVDCKDFNATLVLNERPFTLSDCALTANPTSPMGKLDATQPWEIRLTNGRLRTPLPLIGDSSLKTATLTMGSKHGTLSDARLMLSPGELVVNAVRENASGNWSADVRSNSVDISRLVGEDWKKRFSGVLYGRLQAEGHAEGLSKAEGPLSLQQGVLEALPFLSNIAIGNTYPYRHLKLAKATAHLSYPHADAARNVRKAWVLDQIDLRAEGGWLRVQGHAFVDADGTLGGSLLIGLPENVSTRFVPADSVLHRRIFNASGEAGFSWLRLNLSGNIKDPQEDLSVRLKTLLVPTSLPEAASILKTLLSPTSSTLATPSAPPAGNEPPPSSQPRQIIREAENTAGSLLRSLF